jgi:hypothetical protein
MSGTIRILRKKILKPAVAIALSAALLFGATGCNADNPEEVSSSDPAQNEATSSSSSSPENLTSDTVSVQRDYRTLIKGGGDDVVTVMMYLCGSDLESRGGAATIDLLEMMSADIGENVNVVVETGGSLQWATEFMDPTKNQRWQLVSEDLLPLETIEAANMSEGGTLQNFIKYSAEKFPADRYMLVLWDHGGGTVGGYAYDERYEDNSLMSIADLDEALEGAGVDFDMIGFDCCLMGTAETAFVAEKHADYMVASQRVEPGNGWEYTTWLNALSANTSIPTTDLGKIIVDGFLEHNAGGYYGSELTLSVLDLTYIPDLFNSMYSVFTEAKASMIDKGIFVSTSKMLGESRAMQKDYDLVDIASLAENIDGYTGLEKKLEDCVVYNGATLDGFNGLCMYFPFRDLYQVEEALNLYERIGIDKRYQDFVGSFANLMLGGQMHNSDGTVSSGESVAEDGEYDLAWLAKNSWADESEWESMAGFFDESNFTDGVLENVLLEGTIDGGAYEAYGVKITEKQWELITDIRSCLRIDNGDGFFELGHDIEWIVDDDNNLVVNAVESYNALDGHLVPFYTEVYESINAEGNELLDGEADWYSYGYVPVLFEGIEAEIVLFWDTTSLEDVFGTAVGWRFSDEAMGSQKGLFALEDGMKFDIVCDYYYYDNVDAGTVADDAVPERYILDTIIIDGPPKVTQMYVGDYDLLVYYKIYDLFNNVYETQAAWVTGFDYSEHPEVLAIEESINHVVHGEAEGRQRFTYASTNEGDSMLLLHDVDINVYALYKGKETVNGNNVTITDSESGKNFTFTVIDAASNVIQIETEDYGQVKLEECDKFEAAVDFYEIPYAADELDSREESRKEIVEKLDNEQ